MNIKTMQKVPLVFGNVTNAVDYPKVNLRYYRIVYYCNVLKKECDTWIEEKKLNKLITTNH